MARAAPLRFLAGTLGAWTIVRVALLWPTDLPMPLLDAAPVAAATRPPQTAIIEVSGPVVPPSAPLVQPHVVARLAAGAAPARAPAPQPGNTMPQPLPALLAALPAAPPATTTGSRPIPPGVSPIVRPDVGPSRLHVDSWLVARPGGGDSLAFGQLGASQGGARLTYAVDDASRLALSARISAPRRGPGAELGLGVDLRPTSLPVHLLVEQRFGLDGGGTRPAATVIAGGSVALPAHTRLDAYAQGGAVRRRGGFADAAALLVRPVAERGTARVELGAGAWGAAQRRVARLDLGPSVALVAPAGGHAVRLQLDYRLRVAGRARPGSGPALTLGGSF